MIKKNRDRRVRFRKLKRNISEVFDLCLLDCMFFGTYITALDQSGIIHRLDPLTHYIKDDIIFCKSPEKCDCSTMQIKSKQNIIPV